MKYGLGQCDECGYHTTAIMPGGCQNCADLRRFGFRQGERR